MSKSSRPFERNCESRCWPRLVRRAVYTAVAMAGVVVFCQSGTAEAGGLYMCRSLSSGAMEFTNVPNSPDCSPVALPDKPTRKLKLRYRASANYSDKVYKGSAGQFDHYIRQAANKYHVDASLIKAIIHTESNFDHRAVSKKGAQGLMQLMPATARELRVGDPFNPHQNINGGTRYIRQMLDNFNGDLIMSLAAYNAGPGLVSRTGGVPMIPETLRYVNKVLKKYKYYKTSWNQLASLR